MGVSGAARSAYRGSIYRSREDPEDQNREVAAAAPRVLSTADYVPGDRLRYFSWCDRPGLADTGWSGTVGQITPAPNGGLVRVRVQPRLEHALPGIVSTGDCRSEVYHFKTSGEFTYRGAEACIEVLVASLNWN